jgi:HD-GYP domain-containing protein (c-di-GMP phosphodiesterase class II)
MVTNQLNSDVNERSKWTKVYAKDLALGMFVIELDRPWHDTPFPVNGFHLRKFDQIQSLRLLCNYVYIDTHRGAGHRKNSRKNLTILSSARERSPESGVLRVNNDVYPRTKSVKQEIDKAAHLYSQLNNYLNETIKSARDHKPLNINALNKLAGETIDCVIRNPDAFIWVLNINEQGNCILSHSIRASIWATIFACHAGFAKGDIEALFLGTFLADIGMAKFPPEFVTKSGPFSRKEYKAYCKHVRIGVDIVGAEEKIDARVVDIIRAHHERHDGLGFPSKQSGDQIPALARIANLAYSYERLLRRSLLKDQSPATAISRLYKQRKLKFAEQLVFEFIKALGMFPAGSVVELENGSIGIVTEQNPNQRLTPKIVVITTSRKQRLKKFLPINQDASKNPKTTKLITRSLKKGSYKTDPAELTPRIFGKRIGLGKLGVRL